MLCSLLTSAATDPLRVAFKGELSADAFGQFCRIAFAWGRIEPCVVIAEELAWVTNPSKAPRGWLELVTGGLKYGIDILSITQRPAESDKTALSQASIVRCFQQERHDDAKYMAKELRVDQSRIDALERLHYIEKDRRTQKIRDGALSFV